MQVNTPVPWILWDRIHASAQVLVTSNTTWAWGREIKQGKGNPHLPVPYIFGTRCLVTCYIVNWEQKVPNIWVFPKIGEPQYGWFMVEHPIKMDDLGEHPIFGNIHIGKWKMGAREIRVSLSLSHFCPLLVGFLRGDIQGEGVTGEP